MIKIAGKLGLKENFFIVIKDIYKELTANIILNPESYEILKAFPMKSGQQTRMSTVFNIVLGKSNRHGNKD